MLAQQFHKPMIKNFKRSKVYATFNDKNCTAYLAKMGSISSKNCDVKYLLWVIYVFTKYARVNPLKGNKAKTVFDGFIEIVTKSKRKAKKLWVDQWKNFYNSFIQKWLDDNDILTYPTISQFLARGLIEI